MAAMLRLAAVLLIALAVAGPALAQLQDRPPLPELLERAGASATARGAPDPSGLDTSPTREQQLPFFRAIMAAPLDAPYRAGVLVYFLAGAALAAAALNWFTAAFRLVSSDSTACFAVLVNCS